MKDYKKEALKRFEENNDLSKRFDNEKKIKNVGNKINDLFKNKHLPVDLSLEILDYTYEEINYRSNFKKV